MVGLIEFANYQWLPSQPWGDVHPSYPEWWHDPSCVDVTDNILRLQTKRHTRINGSGIQSYVGVGLVSSIQNFAYGDFEADVMLPKGTGLWPAFWLWGSDRWPPEIDIFEGYSGACGLYAHNRLPYYALKTNIWWPGLTKITPKNIKAKSHMIWRRFDQCFVNFRLEWRKDRIEIFYNSKSVRKVTDPKILQHYNSKELRVIFNNGVDSLKEYTNDSVMLVKNFKYKSI